MRLSTQPDTAAVPQSNSLQALTDRCVLCGLCSQHCPTYALSPTENESPRGRIALINAANQGLLSLQGDSLTHLEHCTGCRSCEAFCPSGVRFGEIMGQGLHLDTEKPATPPRQIQRLLKRLEQPQKLGRLGSLLKAYQRSGVQWLARHTGILKPLGLDQRDALLPTQLRSHPFPTYTPAEGTSRGEVALFTGCVSRLFDYQALNATRLLLSQLGYGVHIPSEQGCCGALHQHSGETETAQQLANTNVDAFAPLEIEAIVHTATGCTAHLSEYAQHLSGQGIQAFSDKVEDINSFLTRLVDNGDWPKSLQAKPLPQSVLVHEPCSLRNVLKQAGQAQRLLSLIPTIDVHTLPQKLNCCGAGGAYMITQPDFSRRMRDASLTSIEETGQRTHSQTLLTTNIGCALHLAAGLREQGQNIEVLHPVTLLARQLGLMP